MVALVCAQAIWGANGAVVNYTNPEDDFTPTDKHKQAHSISGEDFERNEEYVNAVITTPIVLVVLGIVSVIFLQILICCCSAKIPKAEGHKFAWITYYFLVIATIIVVMFVYLGYDSAEAGLEKLRDFIVFMDDEWTVLFTDGEALRDNYDTMTTLSTTSSCCALADISYELEQFDREVGHYEDDSEGVINNAEDVVDYIDGYGSYGIMLTLLTWFFVFFSMIFYLIFGFCKSAGGVSCAKCCGCTSFHVVMLLGALFMILTAVVGDICYDDPTLAILEAVPPGKGQDYLIWYSTCGATGYDPLLEYTDLLEGYSNDILDAINSTIVANPSCASEAEFIALKDEAEDALDNLDLVEVHAECSGTQDEWFIAVNEGVCEDFFTGLRTCWLVALISTLLMWILQIPAAVISKALTAKPSAVAPVPPPESAPVQEQQMVMMVAVPQQQPEGELAKA